MRADNEQFPHAPAGFRWRKPAELIGPKDILVFSDQKIEPVPTSYVNKTAGLPVKLSTGWTHIACPLNSNPK